MESCDRADFFMERVGMRFEHEVAKDPGVPVVSQGEDVLAWSTDPPHIRLYAWGLLNLSFGKFLPINTGKVISSLRLSAQDFKAALSTLRNSGDLIFGVVNGQDAWMFHFQHGNGSTGEASVIDRLENAEKIEEALGKEQPMRSLSIFEYVSRSQRQSGEI